MAAPGTVKCARTFSLRSLHIGENSYSENFEIAHSIPIQTELIELTSFLPYTGERIGAYVGIDRRPDIQLQGVGMWSRRPGAVGR